MGRPLKAFPFIRNLPLEALGWKITNSEHRNLSDSAHDINCFQAALLQVFLNLW